MTLLPPPPPVAVVVGVACAEAVGVAGRMVTVVASCGRVGVGVVSRLESSGESAVAAAAPAGGVGVTDSGEGERGGAEDIVVSSWGARSWVLNLLHEAFEAFGSRWYSSSGILINDYVLNPIALIGTMTSV